MSMPTAEEMFESARRSAEYQCGLAADMVLQGRHNQAWACLMRAYQIVQELRLVLRHKYPALKVQTLLQRVDAMEKDVGGAFGGAIFSTLEVHVRMSQEDALLARVNVPHLGSC